MKLSSKEREVLKAIVYADIFQWPIRKNQKYVLNLKNLLRSGIIQTKNNFYFLPGKSHLIERRLKREKWAREKLKIGKKAAGILKIIPTIKSIGISGGLAVGNVGQKDDIDFFIVCYNGTLWTTRFFSVIFLDLYNLRRRPAEREVKDKICLNMFVDEIGLAKLKAQKDIFTQHELSQLKFAHRACLPVGKACSTQGTSGFIKIFEPFFKFIQLKYMEKRKTSEKIEKHILAFHPQDKKSEILAKYQKSLKALGLDSQSM